MIPYFSDVIFNTRRLAPKEATTLQDTTTLTQIGSIISVVGKTTVEIIELFKCTQKVP